MRWWTLSAFINIFTCFFAIATGVTNLGGVSVVSFGIRFQGFFKDPNVLGPFLTFPAAFWFEKYLKSQKKSILYLFISIILMLGVVMTFSRAAWLNIFFAIFILLLLNVRKVNIKKYFRMISFVFLIMLLLALLIISDVEIFGYRLGDFFLNRLGLQSYDQDRFEAQKAFFKGIEKAPFFGIGPGNYSLLTQGFATHSLYLRMFGEKGIFGFFLLLVIILVSLKNFWEIRKSYAFLFTGFMGTLINFFY
jgi:O-antigen ligase